MKGYKVFNPDWTCMNYQFEVGKTFEEGAKPLVCNRGFHFCEKAADCFNYYEFNPKNKVAEVIALGEVDSDGTKSCTNKIQIVREIPWQEVLEIVNMGKGCTGINNSGNCNSGYRNSGDRNSGDWNSGDYNSGNYNSGDCNSGNWNSGNYNSGNCNSGNYNSGDWNETSYVVGCFNTKKQKLKFFDKETDISYEQWLCSDASILLKQINFEPTKWIYAYYMTDEEKAEHPEYKTTGGYLKSCDNTDCCTEWWNDLSEYNRNIIRSIPNFDAEKFYQITGIKA